MKISTTKTMKSLSIPFKKKIKFSFIVISYNMSREIHRTLTSLKRGYQWGIEGVEYEVLVVDNGSSPALRPSDIRQHGENFKLISIAPDEASPSPAKALNIGAKKARGEYLCLMIDGAHLLTPGIIHYANLATKIYRQPIITPHYFFIGPGQQSVTTSDGYNQAKEDELLERIQWPKDGYKLFEIGEIIGEANRNWLMEKFECNCLFINKDTFFKYGMVNESFNLPGGGLVNLELYKRMIESTNTTVVGLIGEGTFHQVHGGDTTNSSGKERAQKLKKYHAEYFNITGESYMRPKINTQYLGHTPNIAAIKDAINKT